MLIESDFLSTSGRPQSRNLQVEEVFARIIVELRSEIRISLHDLYESILTLVSVTVLESVQQFANTIFKVDALG